jgi:UDP-N-acetylglucosamine 2-epimerase (non-hydrolysing)
MKKILLVFGTRPEAIKMAPLVKEFKSNKDLFETRVCVSGQHREMLDQVLKLFDIKPNYDLDIMKESQTLSDVTTSILLGMNSVFKDFIPDVVFVHGDTSTTFSAALAAFYHKIDVAHIEAGLRTGSLYSPWPEEANRKLTTQITSYHFAPTKGSKSNLLNENVAENNILVTGNTVIDALFWALKRIKSNREFTCQIMADINNLGYKLKKNKKFILVTGHRRENHGQGFIDICKALKSLALANKSIDIVYPVHLSPSVQEPVKEFLSNIDNVFLLEPLRYEHFIYMMDSSYFIITDSGGVQEEAPSLGKPVLVMRNVTERPEAVKAGTVKLVGTSIELIIKESQRLLDDSEHYDNISKAHNPYGDGDACRKIVSHFKSYD